VFFLQPPIAGLAVTKHFLDHIPGMLDLSADTRQDPLESVCDCTPMRLRQRPAFARPQGDMPPHRFALIFFALVHALVAEIANGARLLTMQQGVHCVTSLTLAAVPTTVCTSPVSASAPTCALCAAASLAALRTPAARDPAPACGRLVRPECQWWSRQMSFFSKAYSTSEKLVWVGIG